MLAPFRRIFLVEDVPAIQRKIFDRLQNGFDEIAQVVVSESKEDAIQKLNDKEFTNSIDLALIDLELDGPHKETPSDRHGIDVLNALRSKAPWIPAVLVTRYIETDETLLQQISGLEFDAILPKAFFIDRTKADIADWKRLISEVTARRIGSMTGRSAYFVTDVLGRSLNLIYGRNLVKKRLEDFGEDNCINLLKVLGIAEKELALSEIEQGKSGLLVVKASTNERGYESSWLVKMGADAHKIAKEVWAHRGLFVSGMTHDISVPLIWFNPLVLNGIGILGYEFADQTCTAFQTLERVDGKIEEFLLNMGSALNKFHFISGKRSIIPSQELRLRYSNLQIYEEQLSMFFGWQALFGDRREAFIENPIEIDCGREHGDLHLKNILVKESRVYLIDFAHFREFNYNQLHGIPAFDIVRLLANLAVLNFGSVALSEIASGTLFERVEFRNMFMLSCPSFSDEKVRQFLTFAARCELMRYLSFDDTNSESKIKIKEALLSLQN